MVLRIAVVNLKGGTGKTTSAVFLASALSRRGRTLLVDADPQGSALSWASCASDYGEELPFGVMGLPVRDVHRQLQGFVSDYDHVVIDTPPGETPIVRSALLGAEVALLAMSPGIMDLDRIRPTLELIAEVEPINEIASYILLTRVMRITSEGAKARAAMGEAQLPVLDAEVPRLQFYSEAFGFAVEEEADYEDVVEEIMEVDRV